MICAAVAGFSSAVARAAFPGPEPFVFDAFNLRERVWFHCAICAGGVALGSEFSAAIVTASLGNINFAADNGLHAACCCLMIKILRGKKIAVIRDGHSGHAAARGFFGERLDFASAVEKAVVRVQMQVNESRRRWHGQNYSSLEEEVWLQGRLRKKLETWKVR